MAYVFYIHHCYNEYAREKKILLRKSCRRETTFIILYVFIEKNLCKVCPEGVQPYNIRNRDIY